VVIPAYNAATYVPETIASVAQQSFRKIELIIVDDGSTDGTRSVIEACALCLPFKVTIISQQNRGRSAARNLGCQLATGRWVQFLDADDVLVPDKIEIQLSVAETCGEADVIYSPWQHAQSINDSPLTPLGSLIVPAIGERPWIGLLDDSNYLLPGSYLVRRKIVSAIGGFDETMHGPEDTDFLLRVAFSRARFRIAPANRPLFLYRNPDVNRPVGTPGKYDTPEALKNRIKMLERLKAHVQTIHHGALPRPEREIILRDYTRMLRSTFQRDRLLFREILSLAKAIEPRFVPRSSKQMRVVSWLLGYERAEFVALFYRNIKRRFVAM
jgi:glycosyltransferase involved in cell wall biosynthesis